MFPIIAKEELGPSVFRLRVRAPLIAAKAQPGQFLIVVLDEKGERVPFTLSDWDAEGGTVDFVFLVVGPTTEKMARLQVGDTIAHCVGPLGRPSHVDTFGHVVCLVSGYGIAAMVPVLRALKGKDNQITTIVQAPDKKRLFGLEALKEWSDKVLVATSDNGNGKGPLASDQLRHLLAEHPNQPIHRVVAMCSLCLMRVVTELTRPLRIPTFLHMTPIMVDGTGMCGACRLQVEGTNRFACVHGPEFDGHKIGSWDVLLARRCSYADENVLQQSYSCRTCSQW